MWLRCVSLFYKEGNRTLKKTLLYLPEKSGPKANACSFLRMLSPLSALVKHSEFIAEELVSLTQLFKPGVIALTTNRTAVLDFPGLLDLILSDRFPPIQLHWDTDDYSGSIQAGAFEQNYLQRLSAAQAIMEKHANLLTASTEFIRDNSIAPARWKVIRNSIPFENWNNPKQKNPETFLFFGLNVHRNEIQRLSEAFDNISSRRLKRSHISIEVVGNFNQKLNKVFVVTNVPDQNQYYPRFASWLSNHSRHLTGLVLIEDSLLNKGKSALKFLEYSAMGMATAGYSHTALTSDLSSANRFFEISRNDPAEDLLNLVSMDRALLQSADRNREEIKDNRGTATDISGMYHFYLKNLIHLNP